MRPAPANSDRHLAADLDDLLTGQVVVIRHVDTRERHYVPWRRTRPPASAATPFRPRVIQGTDSIIVVMPPTRRRAVTSSGPGVTSTKAAQFSADEPSQIFGYVRVANRRPTPNQPIERVNTSLIRSLWIQRNSRTSRSGPILIQEPPGPLDVQGIASNLRECRLLPRIELRR